MSFDNLSTRTAWGNSEYLSCMSFEKTAHGFPLLIACNVRCRAIASWQLFPQLEQSRNQVFNRWSERLTELMNLVTAVLRKHCISACWRPRCCADEPERDQAGFTRWTLAR